MNNRESDAGFGLVEVIISMLLLAIIAVALIPLLWQGIRLASTESATATATRHVNSLVEELREQPTCARVAGAVTAPAVTDGRGSSLTTSGSYRTYAIDGTLGTLGSCASDTTVRVQLAVTDSDGDVIARTTALVFIP
ncbi:hypothetical protein ASD56_07945 [Microbacterium sp. Root166]|uniref:type IV pilus modification PilV family protein n=1 Tax=Microbacterium sp. Root166 TaxID=1736478 RepID=UPI0006FF80C0|nr:prepilin-type N-terminal cleavage/methylation domain-containing protein [Microbacterium sp. Root166]KQZ83955.1 hypothetical protein ASD56_07945 [Microbacterium sp. Root166]